MNAHPTVSCLGVIGTTPARLVRPRVGLIPTIELAKDGHKMEPSVSVPSDTAAIFAATDIADPLLDPQGSAEKLAVRCYISHLPLATSSTPTAGCLITPIISPLTQASLTENNSSCSPQLDHHASIPGDNGA